MKFARRSLGTATSKPGRGLTPGHPIRPGTFSGCCDPGPDLEAGCPPRPAKDRGTYLPTVLFTETANLAWLPVGEGAL